MHDSPTTPSPAATVATELQLIRFANLKARLDERARFQLEAIEGAVAPAHPDDVLEHEKLLSYRRGLADAFAYASKYIEEQRVELARISRAFEVVP